MTCFWSLFSNFSKMKSLDDSNDMNFKKRKYLDLELELKNHSKNYCNLIGTDKFSNLKLWNVFGLKSLR